MNKLTAYTDGSANWKTGEAGAACYFVETGKVYRKSLKNSKTGRSEIHGLLLAIENTPANTEIIVYSDSMYVVNAISKGWLKKWLYSEFLGIKNEDLWRRVDRATFNLRLRGGHYRVTHIKGHTGVEGNEIADYYANYKLNLQTKTI